MSDPTPVPPGEDSVQSMHERHQDIMNDPVMLSADGTTAGIPGHHYQDSVARMHDVLMREQAEPRDGFEPVPFWVAIVCGGLLMWGGYYLGTGTADFRRDVYDRSDLSDLRPPPRANRGPDPDPQTVDELKKIGQAKYQQVCISCHKDQGQGDPVQKVPPLAGSEWVDGPEASPARLSRILLYGMKDPVAVKGGTYNGQMPAQGGAMRDYEIAGVLTFVRNSFGNAADKDNAKPAITAGVVKAAREKEAGRATNNSAAVTEAELKTKYPPEYTDVPKKDDAKKDEPKK
jgi:mono/diheme cytochrome c family protein